jgi:hypothetical protein
VFWELKCCVALIPLQRNIVRLAPRRFHHTRTTTKLARQPKHGSAVSASGIQTSYSVRFLQWFTSNAVLSRDRNVRGVTGRPSEAQDGDYSTIHEFSGCGRCGRSDRCWQRWGYRYCRPTVLYQVPALNHLDVVVVIVLLVRPFPTDSCSYSYYR